MKKAMTSFAALLLSLALLAGCVNGTASPPLPPSAEMDQGQTEIQAPPETEEDAAAPSLAPAETYPVETEELYTDNDGERIYGVLYRPAGVEARCPRWFSPTAMAETTGWALLTQRSWPDGECWCTALTSGAARRGTGATAALWR